MHTLNPDEEDFLASHEGRAVLARAQMNHRLTQAHRGADAGPWTDAMTAQIIRDAVVHRERAKVAKGDRRREALYRAGETAALRAMRDEALNTRDSALGANRG